jgi:hypothetical protein
MREKNIVLVNYLNWGIQNNENVLITVKFKFIYIILSFLNYDIILIQ